MADRRRYFVAVVLDGSLAAMVDGIRAALDYEDPGRIPPHITLAPPRNVAGEDLPGVLAGLRRVAGRFEPFTVELGPVTLFDRPQPVVHLAVRDATRRIHDLAAEIRAESLRPTERDDRHPFVPHVTLAPRVPRSVAEAAIAAFRGPELNAVRISDVTLLEHRDDPPRWVAVADAALGAPVVRGRGGIEVELSRARLVDPEVRVVLGVAPADPPLVGTGWALVARIGGAPVGVAWGSEAAGGRAIEGLVVAPAHRRTGVASRLLEEVERPVVTGVVAVLPGRGDLDALFVARGYRLEHSSLDPRVRYGKAK